MTCRKSVISALSCWFPQCGCISLMHSVCQSSFLISLKSTPLSSKILVLPSFVFFCQPTSSMCPSFYVYSMFYPHIVSMFPPCLLLYLSWFFSPCSNPSVHADPFVPCPFLVLILCLHLGHCPLAQFTWVTVLLFFMKMGKFSQFSAERRKLSWKIEKLVVLFCKRVDSSKIWLIFRKRWPSLVEQQAEQKPSKSRAKAEQSRAKPSKAEQSRAKPRKTAQSRANLKQRWIHVLEIDFVQILRFWGFCPIFDEFFVFSAVFCSNVGGKQRNQIYVQVCLCKKLWPHSLFIFSFAPSLSVVIVVAAVVLGLRFWQ